MKKEVIRVLMNALFTIMAGILVNHYYDIGLITRNGVIRASIICMIHIIYVGVTSMKRVYNSREEA